MIGKISALYNSIYHFKDYDLIPEIYTTGRVTHWNARVVFF
ncbi:MAG TPA: hypothetical protein PLF50_02410 [Candidatus Cloacimonadota bacterium]|nr:hypothetical protein [Candidatus Cloacimonadota bacterium]HOV16340.1 hypothetical protein [Candidatus Cloacimonadota bacterium]HQL15469.1 hypothetical protein [Candidatus Cloacimonadota bacterium]